MNQGTAQHQDPRTAQQVWPSFTDDPNAAPVPFGAVPQYGAVAAPQPQSVAAPAPHAQAWGLAAPQTPYPAPAQPYVTPQQLQQMQQHAMQQQVHPGQQFSTYRPEAAQQQLAVHGGGFAFPTPQGMQVVQAPHQGGMAHASVVPHALPAAATAAPVPNVSKRVRWEVIVPAGTALVLLAIAFVVFTNFDRITGAESAKPAAKIDTSVDTETTGGGETTNEATDTPDVMPQDIEIAPDPKLTPAQGRAAVAKAKQLVKLGRYDQARATIAPLAPKGATAPPAVARLQTQIATASKANDALLAQLGKQRAAGSWTGVLATIAKIERLHPLSPTLVKLRASVKQRVGGGGASAASRAGKPVPASASIKKTATPPVPSSTGGGAAPIAQPPASTSSTTTPPVRPGVANPSAAPSSSGVAAQPITGGGAACADHSDMTMHGGAAC